MAMMLEEEKKGVDLKIIEYMSVWKNLMKK